MRHELKEVFVEEVRPYANNPRKNDAAVEAVKKSIEQCGYVAPIVVDENMEILAGHTRFKAIKKLGWKTVQVLIRSGLNEDQKRKYRLLDNKTNEVAEWDFEMLAQELEDLDFGDMELDWGLAEETTEEEPEEIIEDSAPEDLEGEPLAKPGDIFQLGNHRVMCGDSTSIDDLERLMGGTTADLVFTDPPYGMKKQKDGVANDNLNYDDLLDFNRQWLPLALMKLKDTGCLYCWGIDEPLMDIYSEILKPLKRQNKIVIRNYITWAKHSAIGINSEMQLSYPKETEKCWFIMKGMDWNNNNAESFNTKFERILEYMQGEAEKVNLTPAKLHEITKVQMMSHWFSKSQFSIISEKHYLELQEAFRDQGAFSKPYNEVRGLLGDSNNPTAELKPYFDNVAKDYVGEIGLTDVWRYSITSNEERAETGGHATPKPIALCCRAIFASSRENENVLDLFGGSGSTLIACEQTNRNAYLMELEPKWVDTIIRRWEKFTGKKAELINAVDTYNN